MVPPPPVVDLYEHVLALMQASDPDSTLRRCLEQNGYEDYLDLCLLTQHNIDALMEKGPAGDVTRLWQGGRRKLEILMAWLLLSTSTNAKLVATTTFKTMIDEVAAADEDAQAALAAGVPAVVPSATIPNYAVDLAGNFAKGIKLDESKFPKLENRTNFIVWKRDTKTTAKMLGVWKVLDETYSPTTQEEMELYSAQQSWMYSAFSKTLMTLNSKRIWKLYPDDARRVYTELVKENETDLKMKFAIKELEDLYKNFKWTTKFNGPLASFLDKFSDKANEYNAVKKPPTLTDEELRDQLETAIDQCPELLKALTTVGTIERAHASIAGVATTLSFAKYYEILMETAVLADQSWKIHHPPQARQTATKTGQQGQARPTALKRK